MKEENQKQLHTLMKRVKDHGFPSAAVVRDGRAIQLSEKALLLPSNDWTSYSLVTPIGSIKKEDMCRFNSFEDGSVPFTIIVLEDKSKDEVSAGLRIGEFKSELLEQLENNVTLLFDAYSSASLKIEKIMSKDPQHHEVKGAEILPCPGVFYPASNAKELKSLLLENLSYASGPRILILAGTMGIGKKSTLGYALSECGWAGYKLKEEAGANPLSLAAGYYQLGNDLANVCSSLIVVTDIVSDQLLRHEDSAASYLVALFTNISYRVPVVLLTTITHKNPYPQVPRYLFREENAEVIESIVKLHLPQVKSVNIVESDERTIANPLYELRKHETADLSPRKATNRKLPHYDECLLRLKSKIIGQDSSLEKLMASLKSMEKFPTVEERAKTNPCIMAAGPSGSGKTETGKTLASILDVNYILLNCGEAITPAFFQTRFSGSAAGFVGYGDNCVADDIRPGDSKRGTWGSVIIIDEIEKADHKTRLTFLSLMNEGSIQTSKRTILLQNNIIYFTTNHGIDELYRTSVGFNNGASVTNKSLDRIFMDDNEFEKEFLSRIHLFLEFKAAGKDFSHEICGNKLDAMLTYCKDIKITMEREEIVKYLVSVTASKVERLGVRIIEHTIREKILVPIALLQERKTGVKKVLIAVSGNDLKITKV